MRDLFLKILTNIKAWFVNLEIRYNSPTIIINMAEAIEGIECKKAKKSVKERIKSSGDSCGTEKILKEFLKRRKVT